MTTVVYILSPGHSGSTLLDLLCGTIPNSFSTGELINLPWQIYRGINPDDKQTYCSCGKSFLDCHYWSDIIDCYSKKTKRNVRENPRDFNIEIINKFDFDSKPTIINRFLLKIQNLSFRINTLYKSIEPILYYIKKGSIRNMWTLYDSIAEITQKDIIIDSSKNLNRFMLLKKHRPSNIKLLLLIRNIEGVVSSSHFGLNQTLISDRTKMWKKFYKRTIVPIFKNIDSSDYKIVNYEDLCKNPQMTRRNISKFLGVKLENLEFIIDTNKHHLVAGNPMRHKGIINIKYDERWKDRLSKENMERLKKVSIKMNKLMNIKG